MDGDEEIFASESWFERRGRNCCTVRTDEMSRVLIVSTSSLGDIVMKGPVG